MGNEPEDKPPTKITEITSRKRTRPQKLGYNRWAGWKVPYRFVPIPTSLIHWLPQLNGSEIAVYWYVAHRTIGYHKQWDAISLPQFSRGIVSQGLTIDQGTGLSISGVRKAISSLESLGLLRVLHHKNRPSEYEILSPLPATTVTGTLIPACYCSDTPPATTVTPHIETEKGA
jgi:hypothetical protein